jgi:hypothetical protein
VRLKEPLTRTIKTVAIDNGLHGVIAVLMLPAFVFYSVIVPAAAAPTQRQQVSVTVFLVSNAKNFSKVTDLPI